MVRKSAAATERFENDKAEIESELEKYRSLIKLLRASEDSKLSKTTKQKHYFTKIRELTAQLEQLV